MREMALEDLSHPALGLAQRPTKDFGVTGVSVSKQELDRRSAAGRLARG